MQSVIGQEGVDRTHRVDHRRDRTHYPVLDFWNAPRLRDHKPSQSPERPIHPSPAGPYVKEMSATPPLFEFLKKKAACAGSYNPIVSVPSPFQSPTRGTHPNPAGPNVKVMSATPPLFEFLRKNAACAGS